MAHLISQLHSLLLLLDICISVETRRLLSGDFITHSRAQDSEAIKSSDTHPMIYVTPPDNSDLDS